MRTDALYGSAVNTNFSSGGALAAGVVNWTITENSSTSAFGTTISNVNKRSATAMAGPLTKPKDPAGGPAP